MFEQLEITRLAHATAAHAAARQSVIARNIANADTPGYRAADAEPFARYLDRLRAARPEDRVAGDVLRPLPAPDVVEHTSGAALAPNGNSVSLEAEMIRAVDVRHRHEMALNTYRTVSGIIRASLGR